MEDAERTRVRREVSSFFRINAFEPKKEVLDTCVEALYKFDKEKRKKWMNKIVETLRKQSLSTSVVSQDVIREVFAQISNRTTKQNNSLFNVFDSFSIRRFVFDADCRKMLPVEEMPKVVSTVDKASEAIRHRFQLVAQRISRCRQLQAIKFNTIESLLSSSRRTNDVVVVGMLTQQKSHCYHIEDLTGSLQVEFTEETKFQHGMFTEGSVAIFQGTYDTSLLTVREVASVPLESAEETRMTFGNVNWFGGEDPVAFRCNAKLCVAERSNPNAQIVILSDVHLDSSRVMQAVYHLLSGFSGDPPLAFIFCGNFCSKPRQRDTMQLLHTGFRRLANQLNDFASSFTTTHFVFVPGPDDPCLNMVLPRPHLPGVLFKYFEQIPNCLFATNPVRIQYASQEIVVIRDDLVEKMCRHAVNAVASENIPRSFARTILSQAHLSPLPAHVAPILWEFDHVMSMHPLPDVLVVADKFRSFAEVEADTVVCNPGPFSTGSFGFHVYLPFERKIEDSAIGLPTER
ncbi:nucleic acid-binding domain protein [Necator americanus]|uniref:DNA polymerase epsilon subunit n=1 Tax=Necator americanus TaxID=51031 RepID=W2TTK2_NECAM|nr:nucleic acid-binding domain protein [Necator americanus]ETN85118.1 nucleic acid-binding domain protein [Necator americanus]